FIRIAMSRRYFSIIALIVLSMTWYSITPILAQGEEYKTTYTINIIEDGSATWIIKDRIGLTTQSGEEAFKEYVSALESNQSELEYLSNKIHAIVSEAEAATGRDMGARNFNLSFDVKDLPTGRYGVITYQFKWIGFAMTEDRRITAGDAFAGGLYLSKDDALIITYPSGYKVAAVSPEPDIVRANELIWYGLRDFSPGEPGVVLRSTFPVIWVVVSVIGAGALIIAGGITYKKKQEKKSIEEEILKTDEDKILEILKDAGGVLYQSDIIAKTGFSKSKTSALLRSLKENGRIEKVMKGRKNLIRLK
ncbi:MAG: hypothetical protein IBX41_06925, partial [Methanophagales archaeon]|nr:hypothetical protein [Methanophagales archaeon]